MRYIWRWQRCKFHVWIGHKWPSKRAQGVPRCCRQFLWHPKHPSRILRRDGLMQHQLYVCQCCLGHRRLKAQQNEEWNLEAALICVAKPSSICNIYSIPNNTIGNVIELSKNGQQKSRNVSSTEHQLHWIISEYQLWPCVWEYLRGTPVVWPVSYCWLHATSIEPKNQGSGFSRECTWNPHILFGNHSSHEYIVDEMVKLSVSIKWLNMTQPKYCVSAYFSFNNISSTFSQ